MRSEILPVYSDVDIARFNAWQDMNVFLDSYYATPKWRFKKRRYFWYCYELANERRDVYMAILDHLKRQY